MKILTVYKFVKTEGKYNKAYVIEYDVENG